MTCDSSLFAQHSHTPVINAWDCLPGVLYFDGIKWFRHIMHSWADDDESFVSYDFILRSQSALRKNGEIIFAVSNWICDLLTSFWEGREKVRWQQLGRSYQSFVRGLRKKDQKSANHIQPKTKLTKRIEEGVKRATMFHMKLSETSFIPHNPTAARSRYFCESFFKWEKSIFISFRSSLSATKLSYPLALPS